MGEVPDRFAQAAALTHPQARRSGVKQNPREQAADTPRRFHRGVHKMRVPCGGEPLEYLCATGREKDQRRNRPAMPRIGKDEQRRENRIGGCPVEIRRYDIPRPVPDGRDRHEDDGGKGKPCTYTEKASCHGSSKSEHLAFSKALPSPSMPRPVPSVAHQGNRPLVEGLGLLRTSAVAGLSCSSGGKGRRWGTGTADE